MKRTTLSLVLLTLVAAGVSAQSNNIIEQILVKVNGDILTKTELEQRQIQALRQRDPNFRPGSDADLQKALAEVTPGVIVDAVDELLLTQRGRELGYTLGNEQFGNIIENIKKENKLENDEQFQAALKQEGMTLEDLRKQLERNLLVTRVQQAEVMGKISVIGRRSDEVLRREQELVHHAAADHAARAAGGGAGKHQRPERRRGRRRQGEGGGTAQAPDRRRAVCAAGVAVVGFAVEGQRRVHRADQPRRFVARAAEATLDAQARRDDAGAAHPRGYQIIKLETSVGAR